MNNNARLIVSSEDGKEIMEVSGSFMQIGRMIGHVLYSVTASLPADKTEAFFHVIEAGMKEAKEAKERAVKEDAEP